ncbi:hypothetical protein DFJ58DRAFT_732778 [Suillus subalutaceus]|uniref:uncharacterized protein n=1 Tax=Suillus subalutaceus TaxID=48586 RepID=UPI001B876129|nr:uncharacterized protein DFJ58DRAFT_732778 [Suillus subalutaceus]KAG1840732.1 hypothetical protein DFJ58DRAFT_732778 [Suillus subalutaceus]
MSSTNNNPSRRMQATSVPHIHIESPSGSDQMRRAPAQLDTGSFPYAMYNQDLSFMSSSTLFSNEGSEFHNPQFSPLEDLSPEDLYLEQLFNETQRSQDFFYPESYLTGPESFAPSPDTFQVIPPSPPPQTMLRTTNDNMRLIPVYTPSPSSSYATLSPSPSHESPSSPCCAFRVEGAQLLSDTTIPRAILHFIFMPPATGTRHVRSRSESSMTRPVASQAMLDANQRRRRHEATHMCEECGQTFTAVFSLKRHRQSHTGVKPFACNVPGCNQAFFNQSDCRRHERSRKRHKGLPFSDSP